MKKKELIQEPALEFSFDKKILDQLDRKSRIKQPKSKSKKVVDFSRVSQFKSRKKNLNCSLSPPRKDEEESYPNVINIRKKINNQKMDPDNVHPYSNLLYGLHTVHANLLTFLATERENMHVKPTFQPQITFKGKGMFEGTGKSVADRSETWIDKRKEHLELLKNKHKSIEEKELAETMKQHRPLVYKDNPNVASKITVYMGEPEVVLDGKNKKLKNDSQDSTKKGTSKSQSPINVKNSAISQVDLATVENLNRYIMTHLK